MQCTTHTLGQICRVFSDPVTFVSPSATYMVYLQNSQCECAIIKLMLQAVAELADGSTAAGVAVGVKVTINNDITTLYEDELLSQGEEGLITLDIPVPAHAKCMKISVSLYRCMHDILQIKRKTDIL